MTDKDGNTKVLKSVNIKKDQGVYIHENLNFDKHILLDSQQSKKISGVN